MDKELAWQNVKLEGNVIEGELGTDGKGAIILDQTVADMVRSLLAEAQRERDEVHGQKQRWERSTKNLLRDAQALKQRAEAAEAERLEADVVIEQTFVKLEAAEKALAAAREAGYGS